ncbi:MAG TPA: EAL domain-containing protein [Gemmatimonadales bacterium]|nr:EAL domain-containing protein [Gemmatimonadales bacterium]
MRPAKDSGPLGRSGAGDRLSPLALAGVALFVAGVGGGALGMLGRIDAAARETARHNLVTVLAAAREATQHWVSRQQALVSTWAATRGLGELVSRAGSMRGLGRPIPPEVQSAIARLLEPMARQQGVTAWWLIGLDGQTLQAWPVAGPALLPDSLEPALERALDGFATVVRLRGHSLYAMAPVRDLHDAVVGVLGWVVPGRREFSRLAIQSQAVAGTGGQVYIFDRDGRVLGTSITQAEFAAWRLTELGSSQLTRMARAAVSGGRGTDLEGYRDYRGQRVVGAWEWDPVLDVGFATESPAAQVYHVAETARRTILIGLALTLALFGAAVWAILRGRRSAHALSATERRLAAVMASTTDLVAFADRAGEPVYLNAAGQRLLGPDPASGRVLLRREWLAAAARDGSWSGETQLLATDGRDVAVSQVILCHRGPDGQVDFYSTIARDITERTQLARRLFEEKERAEVTLGSIGDGVIRTDAEGLIEYLNTVAEQLLGCRLASVAGRPIDHVITLANETTREPLENPVRICLRERRMVGRSGQSLLIRPDGREFAIDDSAAPIRDHEGRVIGAVMVFHDVSRARTLARQLAHQASHDSLTGLVNRHEFERRLSRIISRAREEASTHALCYLDLDQFKVVNDTCGHVAGDELLRRLAQALQKKVRRRDTLARLGGDEFGVLLEHCPPDQATRVAHELLAAIQEFRFVWEGKPFTLGVSIGVVTITSESENLAAVLRDADAACYAAKERGRNRVHCYEPNDAVLALRQGEMQWVTRITQALEEHRFRLYGQPIVPLAGRPSERSRCEVLIRLLQPDGTLVAPGAFIPAAERYNLMGQVDRWVIREVVALYARHRHRPWKPIASINLSGASLSDPGLLAFVRDQLARHELSPDTLCFEITETAAIANLGQAAHFIRELKALGCWFALDDFGSGMSSFAYLQSLPVDALKIAGAFIRHIEHDPVEYAMVEAINRVGHVMRLRTVAEGVESVGTIATLRRIGVDYAQGFALGEPIPLEELCDLQLDPSPEARRLRLA